MLHVCSNWRRSGGYSGPQGSGVGQKRGDYNAATRNTNWGERYAGAGFTKPLRLTKARFSEFS